MSETSKHDPRWTEQAAGEAQLPDAINAPLVEVEHVSQVFDVSDPWLSRLLTGGQRQTLMAVRDVSFTVPRNAVYALVGESGSGKSTIGKIIVGLLEPSAGEVKLSNTAKTQMIFQSPFASMNPRWRVRDIVMEPARERFQGAEADARVAQLLTQVGLPPEDAEKYPHQFSGGQRQRIAIARALAAEPSFIVCDEPTSALDVSVQAQVLNLMRQLQASLGLSYLFISHDLAVVHYVADTVGVLYLGRLVEEADRDALFHNPRHPYTQMLLDAAPSMRVFGRETPPPTGEIPDPIDPPPGCAYHPRCHFAQDRCRRELPEMRDIGERRVACHAVQEGRI